MHHWIKSAYELGLRNGDSERNGVTYMPRSPFYIQDDPGGRSSTSERLLSLSKTVKALMARGNPQGSVVDLIWGDEEFELFWTDIDRSLEELSTGAVATVKRDETAF